MLYTDNTLSEKDENNYHIKIYQLRDTFYTKGRLHTDIVLITTIFKLNSMLNLAYRS